MKADVAVQASAASLLPDKAVVTFRRGMIGCPTWRRFIVDALPDPNFRLFRNLDDPEVSFLCVDPYMFVPDYTWELSEEDMRDLDLENPAQAFVMCIMVVRREPVLVTTNLAAPIVIHAAAGLAKQVVQYDSQYPVRYLIAGDPALVEQSL
jgi:flagellar assembly factor FliW